MDKKQTTTTSFVQGSLVCVQFSLQMNGSYFPHMYCKAALATVLIGQCLDHVTDHVIPPTPSGDHPGEHQQQRPVGEEEGALQEGPRAGRVRGAGHPELPGEGWADR